MPRDDTPPEGKTRPALRPFTLLLRSRAFDSLRHREYRLIWYGQVFSSLAQWMDEITRSWLIYALTNSAIQLGLIRGIQAVPFFFLYPITGSAADRYSRKMQLVLSQGVNGLVFALTALLILTGAIQPWHVYVSALLTAIVLTFQQPARSAMVSDSVPPESLTNAIGLNAMVNNAARSTGPACAGMIIALAGTGYTYALQALCFFLATLWTIQLRPVVRPAAGAEGAPAGDESFFQSIIEGWKFSWRNEQVRVGLLTVYTVSLFITPFATLLPVFARDLLQVGPTGQGFLLTGMGIGALLSAFLLAYAGDRLPRGMLMLGSVVFYGLAVVLFAASPWFVLSLVMMGLAGFCTVHSHALVLSVIHYYSPPEFRGRMTALFHMSRVITTVASVVMGVLSSLAGARWAVASMAACGMATMIVIYVMQPRARHIR